MDKPVLIILINKMDENMTNFIHCLFHSLKTRIIIITNKSVHADLTLSGALSNFGESLIILHATKSKTPLTGLQYYAKHFINSSPGAILVDMEQDFCEKDIQIIIESMDNIPDAIIIGGRESSNKNTRYIISKLSKLTGAKVEDFNSGLRGLPGSFIANLLNSQIKNDIWLEMYIQAAKLQTQIIEIPIHSQNNSNSPILINFLLNSSKILYIFFRFSILSMMTAGIDYAIFALLYYLSDSIILSILFARIVAGSFQFFFGKKWVFKSKQKVLGELLKYFLLVGILMLASYGLIELMVTNLGMDAILAKLIAELSLFIISFTMQKKIVFAQTYNSKPNLINK